MAKTISKVTMGLSILALVTAGCSVVGIRTVDEPKYTVVSSSDDFEVRDYVGTIVAETTAVGTFDSAQDKCFSRLFKYISGANQSSTSISMTAPVGVQPESSTINFSGVSYAEETTSGWKMSFVLPSTYTLDTAPQPTDSTVQLRLVPGRKVAVVRFSGSWNGNNLEYQRNRLLRWLKESKLEYKPETLQSAAYNPPWTIPALRRNEIHVELQ